MTATDIDLSSSTEDGRPTGGPSHACIRHRRVRLDRLRRRSRAHRRGPSGHRARPLGCLGRCPHCAGAKVHLGTLDDLDSLRDAAAASDGRDPLAFKHDNRFLGELPGRRRRGSPAPSRHSARRLLVRIDRSSSPPERSGSHRGAWRPNGTGTVSTRRWLLWAAVCKLGWPLPSWCSRSLPVGSARRSSALLPELHSHTDRRPCPRRPRVDDRKQSGHVCES